MSPVKDAAAEEIIIVRRRGGDDDDHHHGGVWKIAYADFMTAMMAFFLVMWLINAANTETKASVASYFNPIKLTDSVSRKKGLRDLDEKSNASEKPKQEKVEPKERAKKRDEKSSQPHRDGAIDSAKDKAYRLAIDSGRAASPLRKEESGVSADDREAGRAFRDPFSPLNAARRFAKDEARRGSVPDRAGATPSDPTHARSSAEGPGNSGEVSLPGGNAARSRLHADWGPTAANGHVPAVGDAAKVLAENADRIRGEAEAAARQLGTAGGPGIDVTIEGDAIVLSLTDTSTFGMFAVGSADPNADLVKLIQSITPILAANGERIVLRGHTDSRPFRGEKRNNNWRLAMARGEAAYAMLLRSGIEEARFERIEAHADRKLKVANDPEAAANRRIDIILRKDAR
jgi:chemotaxis protein MotB